MRDSSSSIPESLSGLMFQLEAKELDAENHRRAVAAWEALLSEGEALLADGDSGVSPRVRALSRVIFRNQGYRTCMHCGRQFTLCGTLLNNGGSCLGLTTLYCCLGRALHVPVHPLLYEDHIAVSLEATSPRVHVEMTRRGAILSPHFQKMLYGNPVTYWPLLDDEQFLAVHLSSRAAYTLIPIQFYDDALYCLDAALELYPEYLAAHINRAVVFWEMDRRDKAMEALELAKTFAPQERYQQRIDSLQERINGHI